MPSARDRLSAAGTDRSQSLTTNDPAALVVDFEEFAALSKNERLVSISLDSQTVPICFFKSINMYK